MKVHSDDRRLAWLEVFKGSNMPGDLTVTWVHPGAICAWHRHQRQEDWMLVVHGTLKVGQWRGGWVDDPLGGDVRVEPDGGMLSPNKADPALPLWTVLSCYNPVPLVIPPNVWHGYQNIGSEPALLITYISQHYDPSDEERLSPAQVPIFWERVPR